MANIVLSPYIYYLIIRPFDNTLFIIQTVPYQSLPSSLLILVYNNTTQHDLWVSCSVIWYIHLPVLIKLFRTFSTSTTSPIFSPSASVSTRRSLAGFSYKCNYHYNMAIYASWVVEVDHVSSASLVLILCYLMHTLYLLSIMLWSVHPYVPDSSEWIEIWNIRPSLQFHMVTLMSPDSVCKESLVF